MIERMMTKFFGGSTATVQRDEVVGIVPKAPEPHPYAIHLLELQRRSYVAIREEMRALAESGKPVGRVIEVCDGSGAVVDYRARSYPSLLEAGIDAIAAEAERNDPARAARLRELAPLAERFELYERLQELHDASPPQDASFAARRVESEAPATRNPVPYDEFSAAGRSYEMAERTRQANADRRAFLISRAAEIEAERNRDVTWSPNTDWAEKVQLLDKLARWADKNPEFAEQCRAWEGDHGRR